MVDATQTNITPNVQPDLTPARVNDDDITVDPQQRNRKRACHFFVVVKQTPDTSAARAQRMCRAVAAAIDPVRDFAPAAYEKGRRRSGGRSRRKFCVRL